MSDAIEIIQKAAIGSETTQIGIQQNQYGLSVAEATDIAFSLFREYYPKLREEALNDVRQMITRKLQGLPAESIVSPSPRIVVPALQNASLTEEVEIREFYANLLASAMNKVVRNNVHPGFVEIIKQLCPDEAKIMEYIYDHDTIPTITLRFVEDDGGGIDVVKNFSNIGELTKCEQPFEINKYFDNLIRLGLLENPGELASLTNKVLYEPLKRHRFLVSKANELDQYRPRFTKTEMQESYVCLSDYGKAFCSICLNRVEVVAARQDS